VPADARPKTLEQAQRESELIERAKKGLLVEPPSKTGPGKTPATRSFNVYVDGEYFQVEVDPGEGSPAVVRVPEQAAARPAAPSPAPPPRQAPAATAAAPAVAAGNGAVVAPMPGMIIEYRVKQGDAVKTGDVLLILEAMKMQNEISAERDGTVASVPHKNGDQVDRGEVLLVLG
jgi:biotin carboxyl carrier protein